MHDNSGSIIAVNDNWTESDAGNISATGLAPTDDRESALLVTLRASSNYTVVLRGKNGTTGIGLVEVYDQETGSAASLANISSRAFVGTGDQVLIGGVIAQGLAARQVLLRAIGPSLTAKGVSGALGNPTLDLYDSNGNLVAHNDNWREEPDGTVNPTRVSSIMATGLPPENPAEAAIVFTPAAGGYTAVVRGKNSTTGVGLVEAYRLEASSDPAR